MSPIKRKAIVLALPLFLVPLMISGCSQVNDKPISEPAANIVKENKGTESLNAEAQMRRKVSMTYIVYWKEGLIENGSRLEALKKTTNLNVESIKTRKNMDVIMVKDNLSPHDILMKINNSGMVNQVVQEQLITTQ
ncbi:hypothetical protein EKG38_12415 [Shewanella canadensis]|uniref:Uncharacterized protein n=1 Tax=Shewanella canadensis TaxID=271096 RepID=A0A3S0K963_9GAMM|nr:hypothetical protein [Shewanella canadensis]RTR38333.1 hypothetical protein EKG38_12415 [Shewanella canadensis]